MTELRRSFAHTNASVISMIQRFTDISIMLAGITFSVKLLENTMSTSHWILALTALAIFQMIGGITDFYRSWRGVSFLMELQFLIKNWSLSIIFTSGVVSLLSIMDVDFIFYLVWYISSSIGFIIARSLIRFIMGYIRKHGYNSRNVVIVGSSATGIRLAMNLRNSPWLGFNVLGFYCNENNYNRNIEEIENLGCIDALIKNAHKGHFDRVYIALPMKEEKLIQNILSELSNTTCTVMLIPDLFTVNVMQSRSEIVNGIPVISLYDTPMSGINMVLKRVEDFILAIIILITILPFMLGIALIVKLTSRGPVFFKQERYGMDGKAIQVWKFRSMTVMENGANVIQAKKNDSRFTPIGGFLRRTSLDELPQFINVLKGDMSIVGPRPHAIAHNELYRKLIKGYMLRHKMKPGITGWAQINGWRGETDTLEKMEKRVEFDLFYIQNWSVWFDLKIVFLTVFKGFINKSAY